MTTMASLTPTTERLKQPTKKRQSKTINDPGSQAVRIAQACDRCRAKKVKCDGKLPTCLSCAAVGFKCIVSDKLSRRAFPKGYTETLEERIRQLEAENTKLTTLLDIRDEQVSKLNSDMKGALNVNPTGDVTPREATSSFDPSVDNQSQMLTSSNLELLGSQATHDTLYSHRHDHHDGVPCSCSDHPHIHNQPVSISGSFYNPGGSITGSIAGSIAGSVRISDDDDEESLLSIDKHFEDSDPINDSSGGGISPAPGAFAAATAIALMQKNMNVNSRSSGSENDEKSKQLLLTALVAASIPRSTEETLVIPALLAKICQTYGYSLKPAILTANVFALLKEAPRQPEHEETKCLYQLIMNRYDTQHLPQSEALFFVQNLLQLPPRVDMDHLITIYFQEWGNVLPIVDKNWFLQNYMTFSLVIDGTSSSETKATYELLEQFGATLIVMLGLSMLPTGNERLSYYDYLVTEFIKPNCIVTLSCSIQSLQILALALQYCLSTGDTATCYELRGRVISMAQQLRMHRCPAAVLGILLLLSKPEENMHLQNFKQAERRILFWCIYSLDVYTSFALGVPRLLKDFEIECAIPFAGKRDDDVSEDNVNILVVNNTKLQIVGKVLRFTLSVMLYLKVFGSILDLVFSRYESGDMGARSIVKERMLDTWRKELPQDLRFEMDVNGLSLSDIQLENYTRQQRTLIFMYYHAKVMIHLPVILRHGDHNNVGLSQKEVLNKGIGDFTTNVVSSISIIQQLLIQKLQILKSIDFLPVPVNLARQQVRSALFVARGATNYVKNGALYHSLRTLLLDTVQQLSSRSGRPGSITLTLVKLLELAILSILGLNLNKLLKKKASLRGTPGTGNSPSSMLQPTGFNGHINGSTTPVHSSKLSHTITNAVFAQDNTYDTQSNYMEVSSPPGEIKIKKEYNDDAVEDDSSELEEKPMEAMDVNDFFNFDPFKINMLPDMNANEFAADGSVGLVPFLEMNEDYNSFDGNEGWNVGV